MGIRLIALKRDGTPFKRKNGLPNRGERFTYALQDDSGDYTALDSKYYQYYDPKRFNATEKYINTQNPVRDSFVIFENKNSGQLEAPDRRKNQMALQVEESKITRALTHGYVRLSKFERLSFEAQSAKAVEAGEVGFFKIELDNDTLYDGIIRFAESKQGSFIVNPSNEPFVLSWYANLTDNGARVKLMNSIFKPVASDFIEGNSEAKDRSFAKAFAKDILDKMASVGYRFTSLAVLNRFDKRDYDKQRAIYNSDVLAWEKKPTDKFGNPIPKPKWKPPQKLVNRKFGGVKRKDLSDIKQYKSSIEVRYEIKDY